MGFNRDDIIIALSIVGSALVGFLKVLVDERYDSKKPAYRVMQGVIGAFGSASITMLTIYASVEHLGISWTYAAGIGAFIGYIGADVLSKVFVKWLEEFNPFNRLGPKK